MMPTSEKLLEVMNLRVGYGKLQILCELSFQLVEREFVALVGPNGAGKTTTLRAIAGLIQPWSGEIRFRGQALVGQKTSAICRKGIRLISEDSNIFRGMSVEENLLLGAYSAPDRKQLQAREEFVFGLFPPLRDRRKQIAGTLSGGERKMLAISRAVMSGPQLLLVDEPSLGLAPNLIPPLFEALRMLNRQGMAILLIEQNVQISLQVTSSAYVLEKGQIVLSGKSRDLLENPQLRASYFGLS